MSGKKLGLLLICLLALGQAAYLTWGYFHQPAPDGEDRPVDFVCVAPGCGTEFIKTRPQLLQDQRSNPDGAVTCPKCGKALTKRAVRCPSCKKLVPLVGHGQVPPTCPSCGKGLTMAPNSDGPICPGG